MAPQNRRIVTVNDLGQQQQAEHGNGTTMDAVAYQTNAEASWATSRPLFGSQTNSLASSLPYCQPVASNNNKSYPNSIPLYHITNLPMADTCQKTLQRVWKEFEPIIRRRSYNVKSISELCCCGDGLDAVRRKKLRKQSNNVWGYNQTTFFSRSRGHPGAAAAAASTRTTAHTIHLRLRSPQHHNTRLLSWEDVAGTMAHELSHCVHQNHSQAFYRLMEEILEEHATLQVQAMGGLVYGHAPSNQSTDHTHLPNPSPGITPIASGGQRLGGNPTGKSRLLGPGPLGGSGGRVLGGSTAVAELTPRRRREIMACAAERRKRQMATLRRMIEKSKEPCVIEILDDEEDEDGNVNQDHAHDSSQQKQRRRNGNPSLNCSPILLTEDRKPKAKEKRPPATRSSAPAMLSSLHSDSSDRNHSPSSTTGSTKRAKTTSRSPETIDLTSPVPGEPSEKFAAKCWSKPSRPWECAFCTFRNHSTASVCGMCCNTRNIVTNRILDDKIIEID